MNVNVKQCGECRMNLNNIKNRVKKLKKKEKYSLVSSKRCIFASSKDIVQV